MTIIWMIAFAVLVLVELQTLEFTCLNLALGCLIAAAVAWMGATPAIQIGVAAVSGGLGVALLAPQMRRKLLPADMRTGNDLLIGATAEVIEPITPPAEGKVKLNGVAWQALSDRPIAAGTFVYVTELHGAKLTVMALRELDSTTSSAPMAEPLEQPESPRETQ